MMILSINNMFVSKIRVCYYSPSQLVGLERWRRKGEETDWIFCVVLCSMAAINMTVLLF